MKPPPYVGCSGITTPEQAHALLAAWPADAPAHSLMIGVLTSQKVLAGGERNARSPHPDLIWPCLSTDARALNLIHYFTKDPSTLAQQLNYAVQHGGGRCDGVQINVPWPPIDQLAEFQRAVPEWTRVVLQVGPRAIAGRTIAQVALAAKGYREVVTDLLIDVSGGNGVSLDPELALDLVCAVRSMCPDLGIGIAGGLCAKTIPAIAHLHREVELSIGAEGRLRNDRDELDLDKARAYLAAAAPLVCGDNR
jgi:hypothetical protein